MNNCGQMCLRADLGDQIASLRQRFLPTFWLHLRGAALDRIFNSQHLSRWLCNCILYCVEMLKSCHILQKDEIPWRCKPRAHISTFLLTAAGSSFGNFINCFSSKAQMFQNKSCFPSKPSYPKKIVEN